MYHSLLSSIIPPLFSCPLVFVLYIERCCCTHWTPFVDMILLHAGIRYIVTRNYTLYSCSPMLPCSLPILRKQLMTLRPLPKYR